MIDFILFASPLVFLGAFFSTAFIRTNLFSHWKKKSNYKREKVLALFLSYIVWLLFFLFISNNLLQGLGVNLGIDTQSSDHTDWGLNLIPFRTILTYHRHVSGFHYISNIWGNILITIPLGLFMPILWKKCQRFLPLLVKIFFLLLIVETIQLFTGRSADIDDILLNLLGLSIGYLLHRKIQRFFPKSTYQR